MIHGRDARVTLKLRGDHVVATRGKAWKDGRCHPSPWAVPRRSWQKAPTELPKGGQSERGSGTADGARPRFGRRGRSGCASGSRRPRPSCGGTRPSACERRLSRRPWHPAEPDKPIRGLSRGQGGTSLWRAGETDGRGGGGEFVKTFFTVSYRIGVTVLGLLPAFRVTEAAICQWQVFCIRWSGRPMGSLHSGGVSCSAGIVRGSCGA